MNSLYTGANASFCNSSVSRWIGLRLDLLCGIFTCCVAWFCLVMKGHTKAKILIVTMQIVTDLIAWFSYSIRLYAELENYMTSSQRILDYTKLELEDELSKPSDENLKKLEWPFNGLIEYSNATMRYREELAPSIKNLSFKVEAGMKIGIVGRTGSGKSSILQTLFRLVDLNEGCCKIDGVNIAEVGLHYLRKQIAFIP